MKTLLLFPLLLVFASNFQTPSNTQDPCPVEVIAHKWSRSRQVPVSPDPAGPAAPIQEMSAISKPSAKRNRQNDPAGARDPTEDSLDARSAAIEKTVQEGRAPKAKPIEGFAYQVKVHNPTTKTIGGIFWEYQFTDPANAANLTRRQFVCDVIVKPDKDKELEAFGLLGPSDVISVQSLANAPGNGAIEKIVINRIEYKDGSFWQRRDWNVAEIKLTYHVAVSTPWAPGEMCRGL